MTRSEANVRAGAKLRGIRVRLGLSVRDVERLSIELAENRHHPYLAFSKTWITDIEKGRFVPGSFKMASLAEIQVFENARYGLCRFSASSMLSRSTSRTLRPRRTVFPVTSRPHVHSPQTGS